MVRVVKLAEVRREELLDIALELFMAEGYDHVSVEQITKRADVAKGTFYHYFPSKQELLEQLVDRFADDLFEYLEEQMALVEGDALARLQALQGIATAWKMDRRDQSLSFGRFLYSEENVALRHELFGAWIERTRPILAGILRQGVTERVFDIEDPAGTAGVVLSIWYDWGDRVAQRVLALAEYPEDLPAIAAEFRAAQTAQERILGLPAGSLATSVDIEAYLGTLVDGEAEGS